MLGGYIAWKVSFRVHLKMKIGGSSVEKLEPKTSLDMIDFFYHSATTSNVYMNNITFLI